MAENSLKPSLLDKIHRPLFFLIAAVGIWARFHELAWHFTHADDIGVVKYILEARPFGGQFFAIAKNYTYAPFQFLFTALLINEHQTYREMLFWGRLPSCIFGALGIFAAAGFYRFYENLKSPKMILTAALIALSWPAIVNAKQMHNYALGITAAMMLPGVLVFYLQERNYSLPRMLILSAILALLSHMHYQILFFVPALYTALFVAAFRGKGEIKPILINFAASAGIWLLVILPMWHYFLQPHANLPLNAWSCGPDWQYCFRANPQDPPIENIFYSLIFFLGNIFEIFQINTAFIKETHPLFLITSGILFIFFIMGCISYACGKKAERNPAAPYLGIFFGLTMLLWAVLVVAGKIPFGPTRHNLILLPIMAVTASEGMGWIQQKVKWEGLAAGISLFALALFLLQAPQVFRERHDPFTEERFQGWLEQYHPDAMIYADATIQMGVMPVVRKYYDFTEQGFFVDGLIHGPVIKSETLAWVSHRRPITNEQYDHVRDALNRYLMINNYLRNKQNLPPLDMLPYSSGDYEAERVLEIPSDTEIEFSSRTKNGVNGLFFYILKRP